MKKLYELINELSMLLANHVIYMNKLKKAIREGEPFEHKDCHACNFGKMWDEEVAPIIEKQEEDIKNHLKKIEELHCRFHEVASKIDAQNPKPEDEKAIEQAESISTELMQKLTQLKIMLKVRQAV